tara:strand:- start:10694 stop:11230 length:537 start_codon:yes stop_codon:yes gene_type:complete
MKNYINQKGFIFFSLTLYLFATTSCGIYKKVDTRKVPINAQERAKKNVSEGRGISIGSIRKGGGGSTTYQFSTSNSMWRASLDVLDFLPLSNVDYSGGVIISDWYNENSSKAEQLKITIRFLSNEVRSDSLKIIVHQKKCNNQGTCSTNTLNSSKINTELASAILKKAAILEVQSKKK